MNTDTFFLIRWLMLSAGWGERKLHRKGKAQSLCWTVLRVRVGILFPVSDVSSRFA